MTVPAFELAVPARIVFGSGAAGQLGGLAAELGRRAFLVTGRRALADTGMLDLLTASLSAAGLEWSTHCAAGEPDTTAADRAAGDARAAGCDLVIGAGGGSALDLAKAVAGLLAGEGKALDHLEVAGAGRPFPRPAAPLIALPTTAGTGAEATRNAVLICREAGIKASLRSSHLLPRVALVDPRLTLSLPPRLTAATGLDALAQLVESCATRRASRLTTRLALEGIAGVGRSLARACREGTDLAAREDLALAAMISGITLANAGLGAVHGIAGPLGGRRPIAHGVACARLLPAVMQTNFRLLAAREPENPARERLVEAAARLLGGRRATAADTVSAAASWIAELAGETGLPTLADCGLRREEIPALAEASLRASSMKGNPVELTREEVQEILERSLE